MRVNIEQVCQDLKDGSNFPGVWHGFDYWGKASDFHEHPFIIWDLIQKLFPIDKPLKIVETGRSSGSSTMLFSAIATASGGDFISFDIADWNRAHIEKINAKYGSSPKHYEYIVDSSLNADKYFEEDEKIDILFLDSLHSYEQVKQETLIFEKYLADTSLILFHDTVWCFDPVMGWIKDYLAGKEIIFAKHDKTFTNQCEHCEKFNKPNLPHGRPVMMENGRPNFQSPYDLIELSPRYGKLTNDFLKWSARSFEDCIKDNKVSVFTEIQANCGMGILVNKR